MVEVSDLFIYLFIYLIAFLMQGDLHQRSVGNLYPQPVKCTYTLTDNYLCEIIYVYYVSERALLFLKFFVINCPIVALAS